MDKKNDIITAETAIGVLIGAALGGTTGALAGGVIGFLVSKTKK